MPVLTLKGGGKKNARLSMARVLKCDGCREESKVYIGGSPAAPDLSACEEAEKDGWSFDCDFFSMLTGHTVYCPECTTRRDKKRKGASR